VLARQAVRRITRKKGWSAQKRCRAEKQETGKEAPEGGGKQLQEEGRKENKEFGGKVKKKADRIVLKKAKKNKMNTESLSLRDSGL